MRTKVINVEPGAWKDKKPFWAVSVAQEGKEPVKLYASTKEIGEGLKPGQEYDFTLKTIGKEGQPLKYPYITEAVPVGPSPTDPWPGDAPKPAAPFDRGIFIPVSPEGNKPPAPTKLLPIIAQGKPPFLTDTEQFLAKQDSIAWSVALQQATVLVVASIAKATDRASSDEIEQSVLRFARKFYADGQKVLREVV